MASPSILVLSGVRPASITPGAAQLITVVRERLEDTPIRPGLAFRRRFPGLGDDWPDDALGEQLTTAFRKPLGRWCEQQPASHQLPGRRFSTCLDVPSAVMALQVIVLASGSSVPRRPPSGIGQAEEAADDVALSEVEIGVGQHGVH